MLQFRRTFQSEKNQLQELNNRLAQYLSRTKQLEQENACLITEINQLRQTNTTEWGQQRKAEMRDLRRMVGQLSFEKSQAEMEREKLWRELQMVQSLCSEETKVCRDIGGELKGCEKELHHANKTNSVLEQRLFQLENEYKCVEETQRQEIAHLRRKVDSRVVPIITQTYHGPPAVSLEEVQEYARGLSEGWIETFEMYQKKVEEMEQSIRADQARLDDLQREKMLYAAEFDRLRAEAEKQGHIQMHLEEQLMHMQDKCRVDFNEYQVIIEQLEHERNVMSDSITEKLQQHQQLLQVKMDLGMEVAAYRALLEGERVDLPEAHRRVNQHQRERIIDIKMSSQPYTPRASTSTRQHLDVRYMGQTSNQRRSPVPHSGSISPSRVIPISVTGRAQHQSPASRRDMVSFTKARAEAAASTTTKDKHVAQNENQSSQDVQKKAAEEKSVKIKQVSQTENQFSPITSPTADPKSVKVVSPPMMSLGSETEADSKRRVSDEKEEKGNAYESDLKGKANIETKIGPSEKKVLDSVSVEELIEKVMKPAGLDAKVRSSGESKITYHVEKTEQEDGTTKTQIVLESKVEEELDVSEDSALEDLLCRGVKMVSLDDIKGTETGSMIQNLLSGLQGGENLENKLVNVEIIEEPMESHSDEEYEEEVEQKYMSKVSQPSSTYFQIEELENVSHDSEGQRSDEDALKTFMTDTGYGKRGYVHVQEVSRESEPPYLYQEPREYFVSTPDDNLSEPEDGGGITSYGHYGMVDDLSDERYYQDEELPPSRLSTDESDEYQFMSSDHSFVKESFPECIIEEEIHVSPDVQESMLDFLKEDSLDPKEQLRGALEKIQGSVSGQLKEELAFLTRVSSTSPQNLSVRSVQQSTDNGTTTIVAELNVSQTLEDSGLLEEDDLSEEQIVAALRSSNPEFAKAFQGGADGGYSLRVSRDQDVTHSEGLEGFTTKAESVTVITEKHTELGPSEESFTFQMDVNNSHGHASSGQVLQSQILDTPLQISHEKRVATVYLDTPIDD